MDQITYSYSSTTTSSSSSSSSTKTQPPKITKPTRPSYTNSLLSVRKPTLKPMITKQFIAPLPPTPAKVYKVSSSNFKQVVRMLTSTPKFQPQPVRRLKDIAPPPLILSTIPKPSIFPKPPPPPPEFSIFLNETMETNRIISSSPVKLDYFESLSPLPRSFDPLGVAIMSPLGFGFDPFGVAVMSPLGFGLSPSSLSWCSSVLLSPTNL